MDIDKSMSRKKIGRKQPLQPEWPLRFGLTNVPACFMGAMHLVLKGLCWSKCLVYLYDIIIFGRTLQGHRERLSLVLSCLSEAGLKINPQKCKLLSERVVVLGNVVTRDGISTDSEKKRESLRSGQCQRTKARPVTTVDMCQTRLSLLHLYTVLLKRVNVLDGRRSVKKPL